MELLEITHLRNIIHSQSVALSFLAQNFQTKLEEIATSDHRSFTLESLEIEKREFSELNSKIMAIKKEAQIFVQNPFDRIPKEILTIILLHLPSIGEIGKMACVSKVFNSILQNQMFWKNCCENQWLVEVPVKENPNEMKGALSWAQDKAYKYNPKYFDWKWIAKCIFNRSRISNCGKFCG